MACVATWHGAILRGFYNYGHFVGSHPYAFIIIPVLICGGLATGFLFVDPVNDVEELYTPEGSQAMRDREIVRNTFIDQSGQNFGPSSADFILRGTVIFHGRNNADVLDDKVLPELKDFMTAIKSLRVNAEGYNFTLKEVCAKQGNVCVMDGAFVLNPLFRKMLQMGRVQYPVWTSLRVYDLSLSLGRVNVTSGTLVSANSLRMTFILRKDTEEFEKMSHLWETEFIRFVANEKFTNFEVAYSTSISMGEEMDKESSADVFYFSMTFTLMIAYASIVSAGGDCVSTRALLSNAGVIAAGLGIMGSFGLITLIGTRFVNMVGIMPFLTLGIGVDDMFLLMASWSETVSKTELTMPERIGTVFKKAGIGVTITSVTDFLSFVVGATSIFKSVRNFCIYTGTGVLLCYICNVTFFGGCLTLHGRRVYARRHIITCRRVDSRKNLRDEGRSCCHSCMCGGSIPETTSGDQSLCEKIPRFILPRFVMWLPTRLLVIPAFAGYMFLSVWGCTILREGIEVKDLVPRSSYLHKFQDIKHLLRAAKLDSKIDPSIENCWLTSYAKTNFYDSTTNEKFFKGLREFLNQNPIFYNDIVFSPSNDSITASRCQVLSFSIPDSNEQAALMKRMRDLVTLSAVMELAYHPSFIYCEQFLAVLPSTLQTVGINFGVMFVVTCIFLPHPLMVILVMVQIGMIVIGIFGFMSLWNLSLSAVTMIHLIMSVGFSVNFCAHVCAAYMASEEASREGRARDAIIHSSGPILNGALSSFLGISALIFADSYIFVSFFKIMLLVIGFGVMHAVFFVPVVLSFIGPINHVHLDVTDEKSPYTKNVPQNNSVTENGEKSGPSDSSTHDDGNHEKNGSFDDTSL